MKKNLFLLVNTIFKNLFPPLRDKLRKNGILEGWNVTIPLLQSKIIWLVFILTITLSANDRQNNFQQGNNSYQQGDYEQAVLLYKNILEEGYESGELYFNLGSACYKLNKTGLARLYYERASKLLKGDEALEYNLKLLQLRLVDQIESPPEFILSVWWNYFMDLFSLNMLTWLTIALLWLVLTAGAFRLYFRRKGYMLKQVFVAVLIVFIFFSFILTRKIYLFETEEYGVILEPSVTIFAEPKSAGTEVFVLHEGSKVKVERKNKDWFEIKLEDGKTGWLMQKKVEII